MEFYIIITVITLIFYLLGIILKLKKKVITDEKYIYVFSNIMLFYITLFRSINLISFYKEITECYSFIQHLNFWFITWTLFIVAHYNFLIIYKNKKRK